MSPQKTDLIDPLRWAAIGLERVMRMRKKGKSMSFFTRLFGKKRKQKTLSPEKKINRLKSLLKRSPKRKSQKRKSRKKKKRRPARKSRCW